MSSNDTVGRSIFTLSRYVVYRVFEKFDIDVYVTNKSFT